MDKLLQFLIKIYLWTANNSDDYIEYNEEDEITYF
jgi:hypothetical protein